MTSVAVSTPASFTPASAFEYKTPDPRICDPSDDPFFGLRANFDVSDLNLLVHAAPIGLSAGGVGLSDSTPCSAADAWLPTPVALDLVLGPNPSGDALIATTFKPTLDAVGPASPASDSGASQSFDVSREVSVAASSALAMSPETPLRKSPRKVLRFTPFAEDALLTLKGLDRDFPDDAPGEPNAKSSAGRNQSGVGPVRTRSAAAAAADGGNGGTSGASAPSGHQARTRPSGSSRPSSGNTSGTGGGSGSGSGSRSGGSAGGSGDDDRDRDDKDKQRPERRSNNAEKRANHNAVERARRESLNTRFHALAKALPGLHDIRRPSKSVIVNKSLEFIRAAYARDVAHNVLQNALRREFDDMIAEVNMYRRERGADAYDRRIRLPDEAGGEGTIPPWVPEPPAGFDPTSVFVSGGPMPSAMFGGVDPFGAGRSPTGAGHPGFFDFGAVDQDDADDADDSFEMDSEVPGTSAQRAIVHGLPGNLSAFPTSSIVSGLGLSAQGHQQQQQHQHQQHQQQHQHHHASLLSAANPFASPQSLQTPLQTPLMTGTPILGAHGHLSVSSSPGAGSGQYALSSSPAPIDPLQQTQTPMPSSVGSASVMYPHYLPVSPHGAYSVAAHHHQQQQQVQQRPTSSRQSSQQNVSFTYQDLLDAGLGGGV